MLLKILLLLMCQRFLAHCWIVDQRDEGCGLLYSETNQTGQSLRIQDAGGFPDLVAARFKSANTSTDQDSVKSEDWKNKVKSLDVHENCRIEICSEPLLKGHCEQFKQKTGVMPIAFKKKAGSVACACVQPKCTEPQCDSIRLKRKECGRAFIERGCGTCNRTFLTLTKKGSRYLGAGYEKEIKSVVVQKGCTLLTYGELDFEDDPQISQEGIHLHWGQKTVRSYKCECSNITKPDPEESAFPGNSDLPIMLDIPLTSDDVVAMEANHAEHKGLRASLTSLRHRRSSRKAYILVVGMTGSGKSATINFLFDNATVAVVGNNTSTTKMIHQYHIPIPVPELGLRNSELVIIDTPGLGDTEGVESDAKFLSTLEEFLMRHEDLHNKVPNIVLIFGKFDDNRAKGKASFYVKTLRGIDLLKERLFDTRFSNVIFVYTHFMSVKKSVSKNPWSKLKGFREIIEEFTLLPKPITMCVAENEPTDQELPIVNGFYKLPNGEYYPHNLFKKIQEVTTNGQDPIGEAIIRNAFKQPENFKITEDTTEMHNSNSSRFDHFYKILMNSDIDVTTTQVSNLTEIAYNALPPELRKGETDNVLKLLQRQLNVRNIFTLNDVPKSTVDILKLLKGIRKTKTTLTVLQKALGIKAPEMPNSILVGNCYNIFQDHVINISPFKREENQASDIGYMIPSMVSLKMVNKAQQIFYVFEDKEKYLESRLKNNLKVGGTIDPKILYGKLRPGFNILPTNTPANVTSEITVTAIREHQLFEIVLNNNPPLSPDFLAEVEKIGEFNRTDHENVAAWTAFFTKYGTHVVQSAFGGGAIQVEMTNAVNGSISRNSAQVKEVMANTLKSLFRFVDDVYIRRSSDVTEFESHKNIQYRLIFEGGDYNLAAPDFSKFDVVGTMNQLTQWDDSLRYRPEMLQSFMRLIPLSEVVKSTNWTLSRRIFNAAAASFKASLVYVPPPPPPPRDQIKLEEITRDFNEQLNKLTRTIQDERNNFTTIVARMRNEINEERLKYIRTLQNITEEVKTNISLTCFYEEKNLGGDKLCTASADTCINYRMGIGPKSVDTYKSCVMIYPTTNCNGTSYRHVSYPGHNTDFPFTVNQAYFSGKICT